MLEEGGIPSRSAASCSSRNSGSCCSSSREANSAASCSSSSSSSSIMSPCNSSSSSSTNTEAQSSSNRRRSSSSSTGTGTGGSSIKTPCNNSSSRTGAKSTSRGTKSSSSSSSRHLLLLFLLASSSSLFHVASGQQPMPLSGNGDFPSAAAAATDVYVSTYLDRLLAVDDVNYEFQAVILFYLSWRDPRVKVQVQDTTAKVKAGNYTCQLPCQSNLKSIAGGCCDDVWMPYIAFTNLKYLPQDRVVRFGLGWDPEGDGVFYWRSVHAIYYVPMDLRAFPFDTQNLVVQMEVPQARMGWSGSLTNLIPSTTGPGLFTAKTGGDDVSGWGVKQVVLKPFAYPICQAFLNQADGPSAAGDPAPLVPSYLWALHQKGVRTNQCGAAIAATKQPRSSVFWRNPLTRAANSAMEQEVVRVTGLNVIIVVQRYYTRWVLSAIFPIIATTWLGCLVFFLPRRNMESRLGAVVTLFLALAAIQFVIDSGLPSSSYVTSLQQLTLLSYLFLVLVGLENIIIWWLTIYHKDKDRARRHERAQQQYEQKLDAVKHAVQAWMQRTGENRAMKHLKLSRSGVTGVTTGVTTSDTGDASGLGTADSSAGVAMGPGGVVAGGNGAKGAATAVAGASRGVGSGGEPGDSLRLLVDTLMENQQQQQRDGQRLGQQEGGATPTMRSLGQQQQQLQQQQQQLRAVGQEASLTGPAAAGSTTVTSSVTKDDDTSNLKSFPLTSVTNGPSSGQSGGDVLHGGAAEQAGMGHPVTLTPKESFTVLDAAVEAVAAAVLASQSNDGRVGSASGLGGEDKRDHHNAHLGVGAARIIPRDASWSTVSTVGVDYSTPTDRQGGHRHRGVRKADGGAEAAVGSGSGGGSAAAVGDDDGDDDTPRGLTAMEAGRGGRFALRQRQQQREGSSQQAGMRGSSTGTGERQGNVPLLAAERRRMRMDSVTGGAGVSGVGPWVSGTGRSDNQLGKDTSDEGPTGSPLLVEEAGVGPSWWGSSLWMSLRLKWQMIKSDDAYADRLAYVMNKWCAIIQFIAYNIAATLIFVVGKALYGTPPFEGQEF